MTSRLRAARKGGTLYFMSLSWSETSTAPRSSVCQLIRERSDIYSFRLESGAEIYYNMWRQPYLMQIQRTDALSTTAADVWQYRSLSRILINTHIYLHMLKRKMKQCSHISHIRPVINGTKNCIHALLDDRQLCSNYLAPVQLMDSLGKEETLTNSDRNKFMCEIWGKEDLWKDTTNLWRTGHSNWKCPFVIFV